jgi:hypothetical protein
MFSFFLCHFPVTFEGVSHDLLDLQLSVVLQSYGVSVQILHLAFSPVKIRPSALNVLFIFLVVSLLAGGSKNVPSWNYILHIHGSGLKVGMVGGFGFQSFMWSHQLRIGFKLGFYNFQILGSNRLCWIEPWWIYAKKQY